MTDRRPYRRVSPDEMEHVRAFVWEGLRCRELMICAPTFRIVDGEAIYVGYTWGRMMLGIDIGTMLDRLREQAGHQRFIRFLGWVQGDTFKSFDCIERVQIEDDALRLKEMAQHGYSQMFPE
jgi:hypothetical protein